MTVTPQISGPDHRAAFSGWRGAEERPASFHHRSPAVPGAAGFRTGAAGTEQSGAGSGQYAIENVRQHRRHAGRLAARCGDQEEHRGRGPGAGAGGRSGRGKRQIESRILLYPFAHRRPRRSAPGGRGQRGAGQYDGAPADSATWIPIYADFTVTEGDLPEVQRELAQGQLADHGAHAFRSAEIARARASSLSWITPCKMRPAL